MSGQPNSGVASWYKTTIEEEINCGYQVRQPFWSEALGVGSEEWVTTPIRISKTTAANIVL